MAYPDYYKNPNWDDYFKQIDDNTHIMVRNVVGHQSITRIGAPVPRFGVGGAEIYDTSTAEAYDTAFDTVLEIVEDNSD